MLELEVVVMVVGLRSEADLLYHNLGGLGLLLFLPFLLLVEELLVVEYLANRGLGGGRDLDEVELLLFGELEGLLDGVYAGLNVVTYEANLAGADALVDGMGVFLFVRYKGTTGAVVGACLLYTSPSPRDS